MAQIKAGDIVASVTDQSDYPVLWKVKHVDAEGWVTADALGERFTPITGIYKADQWRKVMVIDAEFVHKSDDGNYVYTIDMSHIGITNPVVVSLSMDR